MDAPDLLPGMTLDAARAADCCLLEVISGSRAYGTSTPESDTDIKGVFIAPRDVWMGWPRSAQINNASNDIVFYELGRYAELLAKNNPNLLEMLFTPEDCIVRRHPCMDRFTPALFLSRLCFDAFAGYAGTQIRKARGLNKKIVKPQPAARRSAMDFCYVLEGQGSVGLAPWLAARGWRQHDCGLAAVPHARDLYSLYHDPGGAAGYRGLWTNLENTEIRVSRIPHDALPDAWMSFNQDGFKTHCREWREYHEWLGCRNEARYEGTMRHGQGYDAKNLMHTFRLLDSAEEIARHGRLTVRTPNREWLLRVKAGEFAYDDLLTQAEARLTRIRDLFAESALPERPDAELIERTLISIRREWYEGSAAGTAESFTRRGPACSQ